jgi:hypothetical protein
VDWPVDNTQALRESFNNNGFVLINNVLNTSIVESLRGRMKNLFHGDFETGIYPDEWHW